MCTSKRNERSYTHTHHHGNAAAFFELKSSCANPRAGRRRSSVAARPGVSIHVRSLRMPSCELLLKRSVEAYALLLLLLFLLLLLLLHYSILLLIPAVMYSFHTSLL